MFTRLQDSIEMQVVELTVSSCIHIYLAVACSYFDVLPTSQQCKGQPYLQYRGRSTTAAVCVAALGYVLLFVVAICVGVAATFRAVKVYLAVLYHIKNYVVLTTTYAHLYRDIPASLDGLGYCSYYL